MTERDAVGAAIAATVIEKIQRMFGWWHQVGEGSISRQQFQRRMAQIRRPVEKLLEQAAASAEKKTAGMCREILTLRQALWTFVDVDGVEPTNNAAERAIRPAVLWRKGSFGNDSVTGSRFTERILSTVATLRLHGRNVLSYILQRSPELTHPCS